MKQKLLILATIILTSIINATCQTLTPIHGRVKDGYNFWFYAPAQNTGKESKPVIIFLHGASLCGNDLNKVKRYGTIAAIEKGRQIDAYVIAPQNPGGAWKPSKINSLLEWAEANYNIDSSRVYVLGMSLGGYGTLDMVAAYPEKIAAAMAFCGGSTSKNFSGMAQVPLWIVHGTADRAVPVNESDKVVAGIRNTGDDSRLVYDRVPGMDHGRPARFFYLKESYEWLFSHSLDDTDRRVNKDTFSVSLLADAYKDLGRGKKTDLIIAPEEAEQEELFAELPADIANAILSSQAALNVRSNEVMIDNKSVNVSELRFGKHKKTRHKTASHALLPKKETETAGNS